LRRVRKNKKEFLAEESERKKEKEKGGETRPER
jgi:hypothetical protein